MRGLIECYGVLTGSLYKSGTCCDTMLYQSLKKNRNYNGSQWLWHDNTFTVNNFFNNIKLYLNFGKLIKILNMNFLKCMIIIKRFPYMHVLDYTIIMIL